MILVVSSLLKTSVCRAYHVNQTTASFHFTIVDFPLELKKGCITEFRVTFNKNVEPEFIKKTPFQSSFRSDQHVVSKERAIFIANFIITKKVPACTVDFPRHYEVELLKEICLKEIQKTLSTANAMKSYALAIKYDLDKLSALMEDHQKVKYYSHC